MDVQIKEEEMCGWKECENVQMKKNVDEICSHFINFQTKLPLLWRGPG
jgi:hypothetical protein